MVPLRGIGCARRLPRSRLRHWNPNPASLRPYRDPAIAHGLITLTEKPDRKRNRCRQRARGSQMIPSRPDFPMVRARVPMPRENHFDLHFFGASHGRIEIVAFKPQEDAFSMKRRPPQLCQNNTQRQPASQSSRGSDERDEHKW
jgi:hypothetical protein